MKLNPSIQIFPTTKLIGQKITTSFAQDQTLELWRNFAPRKKEIKNKVNSDSYAVKIYPNTTFFQQFDPTRTFEKWAAVPVTNFDNITDCLDKLIIPVGIYAIFTYRGKPSDAMDTFRYMYGEWLPSSQYEMDNRPYFALMGDRYKGEHPDSEEEFWVPIRPK